MKSRKNKSRKNKSRKGGAEISICTICKKQNNTILPNNINGSIEVCSKNHTFHVRCMCSKMFCSIPCVISCPTCKEPINNTNIRSIKTACIPNKKQQLRDIGFK